MIAEILCRLQAQKLPCFRYFGTKSCRVYVIGFGYDCVRDDYKVFRIAQFGAQGDESNIAAFDIQREEFCTRPLPGLGGSADSYRNLGVLGHCLCLVSMHVHSSVDM
ncbi:hypothetical protein POTOM_052235 [Populus tomentosa]|uniref:Uncharacterized protein n=1 Tax=Populus tomentosa TaxID=118781 RepID=A0A8X7Y3U0_POPTO|nr:hypothetical protein POTOM_052235 [Populus tomentosa]